MQKIKEFYNQYPNLFAILGLIVFLYLFFFSLQLMGTSLKLFGKDFSETLIATASNPVVGLFIGILATSIIQSSSSSTSIVVGMVAGGAFSSDPDVAISLAIPVIMGANIGTSITNTIASLPQINRSNEFKRAFAAATVHDFFNFLSVIVLLPLQIGTNFLGKAATVLEGLFAGMGGLKFLSPVKAITKPLVGVIKDQWGDLPWLLFIIALLLLFISLKYMVSSLKVIVVSRAKDWFDKFLFKTAVRALIVGIILTILVQSSSITTSLIVPMAGAGLLTLEQIFPYTLGANIGTTITAMLAALLTGSAAAVTVAFAHLLFNISGIIVWWPFKKLPILIARKFAEYSTRNKLIPVGYVLIVFFLIPLLVIFILN
jgi:sodium-dependent phosphate cotransporter